MQHTFKVGDVVRHKSCNKEGVVMYTHHYDGEQRLVVALEGEGIQLWNSSRVAPPPPRMVMESVQSFYTHYYPRAGSSNGYEKMRITKWSDGTWKIEKVS
jgi:hypothetical protein